MIAAAQRRAYFVQGRKIKAIARELKLARNTVRDIVRAGSGSEATERSYERKEQPLHQLGEHVVRGDNQDENGRVWCGEGRA